MAKKFTQRERIHYNETLFLVSSKDSIRIIMALTTNFNLEIYQMDVKTTFINGELSEKNLMQQPLGFVERGKESMVCN